MEDKILIILVNTLMAWTQKHFCTDTTKLMNRWWCHQMETFSALLAICAGNSTVPGEFPAHRPVMQSFDVFSGMCLHKGLSKQKWGWWFEMPSCSLWRHCNEMTNPKENVPILMGKIVTLLKWTAIIVRMMSKYGGQDRFKWWKSAISYKLYEQVRQS